MGAAGRPPRRPGHTRSCRLRCSRRPARPTHHRGNGVTLDYANREGFGEEHYAFLVDDATFDAAYRKMLDRGLDHWADPGHSQPGEINTRWGGRGVYFPDPSGHNLEIFTRVPTDAS